MMVIAMVVVAVVVIMMVMLVVTELVGTGGCHPETECQSPTALTLKSSSFISINTFQIVV